MASLEIRCCGTLCAGVEVRGLYDGVAFWECGRCGKTYRRWSDDARPDIAKRVDLWALSHGVTWSEQP